MFQGAFSTVLGVLWVQGGFPYGWMMLVGAILGLTFIVRGAQREDRQEMMERQ